MAVSSVLRPESIVGKEVRRTPEQFQNFISGGSSIGSSVIQNAANKIVGFQRASVRPVVPDINSIISSISSNIVNNVDNSIRNATSISNKNTDKKIEVLKTNITNSIQQIKLSAPINEIQNIVENIQQQINEIQNNTSIEQINQTVKNIQNQINEIKDSQPLKQLQTTVVELQERIKEIQVSDPSIQLQNISNNVQNQITEIKNVIQNIQSQPNINNVSMNETQNIIENIQKQVNSLQDKIIIIENQTTQSSGFGIQNPITQIQNVIENIQTRVSQTLQQKIFELTQNYQEKVKQVDDAKPTGILGKFLDVYNSAIGFVQFFGNKKNIDRLRGNLNALRESFIESFEVAKLVRQTILKIVKQLSNLPKASSSGGAGINIDLDVPGGPLRRSAPRGVNRAGMKGRAGMLGLGLGGMALGGAAVNALQESDVIQPVSSEPAIPQGLIDRFSFIIDRFNSAIDNLIKSSSQKRTEGTSSGGGGGSTKSPETPSPSPGGPTSSGPAVMPEADQELYTLATIAGLESGSAQGQSDVAQAVYNRMAKGNTSATDILTRTGQFEPAFTAPYKISGGTVDPAAKNIRTFDDAVKFRMKKTGEKRETAEAAIKATIANLQNTSLQQNSASFVGARTSFRGSPQNTGNKLSNSVWRGSKSDNQYLNEEVSGKGTAAVPTFVAGGGTGKVDPNKKGISKPSIEPSKVSPESRATLATNISQPARKTAPTINVLPIAAPDQQQTQAQSPSSEPQMIQSPASPGPNIPIIPSSNPENFLVLYSKLVYNIVDG